MDSCYWRQTFPILYLHSKRGEVVELMGIPVDTLGRRQVPAILLGQAPTPGVRNPSPLQ
jgi:hypothetical protein